MTIMDWLENAEYNIRSPYPNSKLMASEQLRNAIFLLAQGYSVYTNIEELVSRYGSIDSIPPRDEIDMTTISDWLDDAQRNFYSQDSTSKLFALKQYIFANNLLGKGYSLDTNVDELLTMYGSVYSIPPRKDHEVQCYSDMKFGTTERISQ